MAVADKITQLTAIRADIRDALVEQGIEDATTHNYIDFAEDILAIEGGGVIPIVITDDTYDMNTTDVYMTENAGKFITSARIREIPADTESIVLIPSNYYKPYPGEALYAYSHAPTPLTLSSIVHLTPHNLLNNTTDFDAVCLPYGHYATISSGSTLPIVMDPTRWYNTFDLSCMVFKTAQIVNLNGQTFPYELVQGKAGYNNTSGTVYVSNKPGNTLIDLHIDDEDFVANQVVYFQIPVTADIMATADDIASVIILVPGSNQTTQVYDYYYMFDAGMVTGSNPTSGWIEVGPHVGTTPSATRVASVLSNAAGAARLRPVGLDGAGSDWFNVTMGYLCFELKFGNATWLGRASQDWKILVALK